jgi:hypothetical protein
MTVAQLIEELQKENPQKQVYMLCECDVEKSEYDVDRVVNEGATLRVLQP